MSPWLTCRFDPFGIFCFLFFYGLLCYVDFVFIVYIIFPILNISFIGCGIILAGYQLCLVMISWAHLMCVFSDAGIVQQQQQSTETGRPPSSVSNCDQTVYDHRVLDSMPMGTMAGGHHPSRVYQTPFEEINHAHNQSTAGTDSATGGAVHQMYDYLDWTYCKKCYVYRPPGAHHCQICRRCILRMDHHCPWINNCVGQYNQKYFIQFTSYAFIGCLYTVIGIIISWALLPPVDSLRIIHITLITLVAVIFGLFAVAVFSDQMQNIFNDTNHANNIASPHLEQQPPTDSTGEPADSQQRKKWILRQVFGDISPILWAIPFPFKPKKIKQQEELDDKTTNQTSGTDGVPLHHLTCAV